LPGSRRRVIALQVSCTIITQARQTDKQTNPNGKAKKEAYLVFSLRDKSTYFGKSYDKKRGWLADWLVCCIAKEKSPVAKNIGFSLEPWQAVHSSSCRVACMQPHHDSLSPFFLFFTAAAATSLPPLSYHPLLLQFPAPFRRHRLCL
jgi:hypothetical protein